MTPLTAEFLRHIEYQYKTGYGMAHFRFKFYGLACLKHENQFLSINQGEETDKWLVYCAGRAQ